jgi:hypothetical protein
VGIIVLGLMALNLDFYFRQVPKEYVLGGPNTETAMAIAEYLQTQPAQTVYFLGWPRMGYSSIASIPFLAPQIDGRDVFEPLTTMPDWPVTTPVMFLFLPERAHELSLVQQRFPNGEVAKHVRASDQQIFFVVYQVSAPEVEQ